MMLQAETGDDVVVPGAGGDCHQNYSSVCYQNIGNYPENDINLGNIVCSMSFEDLLSSHHQGESTPSLPPVETVLPHNSCLHLITPSSISSPSISMNPANVTNSIHHRYQQHAAHNITQHMCHTINNHNLQHQTELFNNNHMSGPHYKSTQSQLFNVDHNCEISNNVADNTSTSSTGDILNVSRDEASAYVSDASTVDADENDNLTDEPFTYLQNLNSDNLMKFSQQSEIMNLMMEQVVDPKMNLNSIPVCDEQDDAGYDFRIQVNSTVSASRFVVYSKETQRLYVKPHENVHIDCFHKVKMPVQPLFVRIVPVYTKNTSDPVLRCQNHISRDTEPDEIIRNSLVRCENLDAVYNGCDSGKSIKDRYSVVIPLNATVKTSDSNILRQQVIINFTCNNSCMFRKQTSVLFILETARGEILAQRVLSVKISTCPKRDRRLCEEPATKRRPLADPDFCPTEPKMAKYDDACIKDEFSRSSYGDQSDDDASAHDVPGNNVDVSVDSESGDFVLTIRSKTRSHLLDVLRQMYCNAISNEVFYKSAVNGRKIRESEYLKKCYEKAVRLKSRQCPAECQ